MLLENKTKVQLLQEGCNSTQISGSVHTVHRKDAAYPRKDVKVTLSVPAYGSKEDRHSFVQEGSTEAILLSSVIQHDSYWKMDPFYFHALLRTLTLHPPSVPLNLG